VRRSLASSSSRRTVIESALVVGGSVVLFLLLPHALAGDDFTRYADIERLLHHGDLTKSAYSLVMPLASAPFLLLGEVVRTPQWWAAHFNVIVVAAGALVLFRLLRDRVDRSCLRQALLIVLFASLLTNRLRDYNAEVFTATLFVVGLVLVTGGRRALEGWAAIVVGVVNTPATLIGAAGVAVAETIRTRRLRYLAIPVTAVLLIMCEAWIRRGGPLTSGYENNRGAVTILPYSGKPGFSYPLLLGVLSILFSLGRGLVFFTPGLLLWFSGTARRLLKEYRYLVGLMLLLVCGLVVVYAKWWAWYGGLTWGPRFFVFAVFPASALIAVRIRHVREVGFVGNALTLFVLTLSAWVGVSGAIADLSTFDFCVRNNSALEALCWYTPEYSSLWHPLVDFPALTWKSTIVAVYCALVFAYLAAPLVAALARTLRAWGESKAWATGWRL
jgi:hypothetical protein